MHIYIYILYIYLYTYTYSDPEIIKKLVKTHSANDLQTIKDHSTSLDIKTIQDSPWSTGM